jgi:Heavy-metal-associated domain
MWLSPFCDELLSEMLDSYRRRSRVDAEYEMGNVTYIVPDLASDQGERAVSTRLLTIPNVEAVVVDLATKGVTVHGRELDSIALRAMIESAGYQAA